VETYQGKTRLFFREMAQIVESNGLSVVVLTDADSQRALTIICDEPMTQQLLIRINHLPGETTMLPEVLTKLLFNDGCTSPRDYELLVYGIDNGQYKAVLTSLTTDSSVSIRISDAILLSTFSDIPLYIDNHLLLLQSSCYTPHTSGLVIPINTISLEHLEKELQKAVAEENYRLASSIYDEIKKRKQ